MSYAHWQILHSLKAYDYNIEDAFYAIKFLLIAELLSSRLPED